MDGVVVEIKPKFTSDSDGFVVFSVSCNAFRGNGYARVRVKNEGDIFYLAFVKACEVLLKQEFHHAWLTYGKDYIRSELKCGNAVFMFRLA